MRFEVIPAYRKCGAGVQARDVPSVWRLTDLDYRTSATNVVAVLTFVGRSECEGDLNNTADFQLLQRLPFF